MSKFVASSGDVFEMNRDMQEVSSMSRPDENWRHVDANGHTHYWGVDGKPVTAYHPTLHFLLPTLKWVFEEWGYYPDGERYEMGHYECKQCGEHVKPRNRADDRTYYIAGLAYYRVNGENVSPDEFKRRLAAHQRTE